MTFGKPLAGALALGLAASAPTTYPIRYAAIGASDTVGVGARDGARSSWTAQLARSLPEGTHYRPFARSGITLAQALEQEIPSAIRFQPSLVTLFFGVNDLLSGVTEGTFRLQLREALQHLATRSKARIAVVNLPALDMLPGLGRLPPWARTAVTRLNQVIADEVARHPQRAIVVNLSEPSKELPAHVGEWLSADGFHPNEVGYGRLAEVVRSALLDAGWLRLDTP